MSRRVSPQTSARAPDSLNLAVRAWSGLRPLAAVADHDPDTAWAAIARHDVALATVRDFADRSGAVRVVVLLDTGDGRTAAVVEATPGGDLRLSEGKQTYDVPAGALDGVLPRPMHPPKPLPASAWQVDPDSGEVAAPLGAVAALGLGVLELATVLAGRTVATADFATRDGEPVTIAARIGEPLILAIGDQQFELPVPPSSP